MDLFQEQVGRLIENGYPDAAGMQENDFRGLCLLLRDQVGELTPSADPDQELTVLLVIPPVIVPVARQMRLLMLDGVRGFQAPNFDRLSATHDGDAASMEWPYLLAGVQLDMTSTTTEAHTSLVRENGGTSLCVWECVALATHTDLLENHDIGIMGTQYSEGSRPGITYDRIRGHRLTRWDPTIRHFLWRNKPWARRRVQ